MYKRFIKRLADILFSVLLLVLFSWLIIIAYILASLDLGKNGLFTQIRVGKGGRPFKIFKIRSLRDDTAIQSTVTQKDDPRMTKMGSILRKTKIDELPQLINVLNGTMSLVGPRPTVQEDVDKMSTQQKKRFEVRPGITGLAQTSGNTVLKWPQRIRYDVLYVKNCSFNLDLFILTKTIVLLFTGNIETHSKTDDEWKRPGQ